MTPEFHPSVSFFVRRDGENECTIRFVWSNTSKVVEFGSTPSTVSFLKNLTGELSVSELSKKFDLKEEDVSNLIQSLFKEQILKDKKGSASSEEFSRQDFFFLSYGLSPEDVVQFNKALDDFHVVILGVGGVGSSVANGLARLGIGNLTLIDPDVVDSTNLQRQSLFTQSDIGRPKAESAVKRLSQISRTVNATAVTERIGFSDDLEKALSNAPSVIVNAADEPDADQTNTVVTEYCFNHGTPHLLASGYDGHLSSIGLTVTPNESACWGCRQIQIETDNESKGFIHFPVGKTQEIGGTMVAVSNLIASIQIMETAKILCRKMTPNFSGHMGNFDSSNYQITCFPVPRSRKCKYCGV